MQPNIPPKAPKGTVRRTVDSVEPIRNGGLIAKWPHYKELYHLHDDVWFIRYYNTSTHWLSWPEARDKYNELKAVK